MHPTRMLLGTSILCACVMACEAPPEPQPLGQDSAELAWGAFPSDGPTTTSTPIGLALEMDQGAGVPLKLRSGQRFYINQIDMRASIDASVDEGVDGLDDEGDFKSLDWDHTTFEEESFVGQPNQDGSWSRRRFYRGADWMDAPSFFIVEQINAQGHLTTYPIIVGTGLEHLRTPLDSFFARRLRAIQWTNDCESPTSCEGATSFTEEALVELRYANGTNPNFVLQSGTTALRVRWTLKPTSPYVIPVEQVADPEFDYGFDMDLVTVTPPGPDGFYAPGESVTFQFTLMDGSGTPLHPPGVMPSYNDVISGADESGIQYYRAFSEPFATYYRRKHREKQLMLAVMGPIQNNRPIRSVVDIFQSIDFSTGIVTAGTQTADGIFGAVTGIPSFLVTLGGPAFWDLPSTDTWTFTIPPDSAPGTYYAVLKGRRTYLGQDIPKSTVLEFQVGSATPTAPHMTTGKCNNCHQGGGSFDRSLHGLDERSACTTCHAPLNFELEGPVYVRSHFIHSRSNRYDEPLHKCKNCHLDKPSIQRTSKSACLSCHTSYPADHVAAYGPVTNMYVGGGDESFQQCSTACHTNHPGSGF
ncbi:MAG: cytochrome C [Polyangiaceae bacterium]|nr:cytochrome C [Polyangiaceae bacterium]